MKRIGLLSDTHGYLDPRILEHFSACDEIWHAGDIGDASVCDQLAETKFLRAVYGNIDGTDIRIRHPEELVFTCEKIKVFMIHIGGYPGNYFPDVRRKLNEYKPGLFICGHSHILKVIPDKRLNLLHMNPGAAGRHGFHKFRTIIRFEVNGSKIEKLEVIELGLRSSLEAST